MPYIDLDESRDRRLALLLQTANQLQTQKIAQEELAIKKQQMDPQYQARQLAITLASLGKTDESERLFRGAGGVGSQVQLPSQQGIPDYLGVQQQQTPRLSAQSVGLPSGMLGLSQKVGGTTMRFGQPGMNEVDKANLDIHKTLTTEDLKNKQESQQAAQKNVSGTGRFLQQFGRSYDELKAYDPEIDKQGFSGWATRKMASIANKFDELPETKAFMVELQPLANQMARDVEGGRVTDQDRKIYADAFASAVKNPSATNIRIASNNLIRLKDRGGDITSVVNQLSSSNIDIMKNIANEVYKEYPELKPSIDSDDLLKKWSK